MNKCSPVEMRKNLKVVDEFKRYGIDFVAVAVKSPEHKKELVAQGAAVLEELANA